MPMRKLARAAFQTGSAVFAVTVLRVVSNKIIALVLGPLGVGIYSLIVQTYQSSVLAGSLEGETALVQGIASKTGNDRAVFLKTSVTLIAGASILIALALALLGPQIAIVITGSSNPTLGLAFRFLGLASFLGVASSVLSSILTGDGAVGSRSLAQTIYWLAVAVCAYPAARLTLSGSYIPLVLLLSVGALASAVYSVFRLSPSITDAFYSRATWMDRSAARHFVSVTFAILLGDLSGTFALLAIRSLITRFNGLPAAGQFDAAWTLSIGYAALFHPMLFAYFMPALSSAPSAERPQIMNSMIRIAVLAAAPVCTALVVLKPLVVRILYTPEFFPAIALIKWFLIADFLKITTWVVATPILSHARLKTFVAVELGSNALMLALFAIALRRGEWSTYLGPALLISYVVNLLIVTTLTARSKDLVFDVRTACMWGVGLLLLCAASVQTWHSQNVNILTSTAWVGGSLLLLWKMLSAFDRSEIRSALTRTKPDGSAN